MSRVLHLSICVRDAIDMPKASLKRMFKDAQGVFLDAATAREALLDHLEQGHKFLPVGPACDGWSFATGCPGHEEA